LFENIVFEEKSQTKSFELNQDGLNLVKDRYNKQKDNYGFAML